MVQNRAIEVHHLGLIDYKEALAIQEKYYRAIVNRKKRSSIQEESPYDSFPNYLLFCEHPSVYTLGRSGSMDHLLVDAATLQAQAIALYHVNRGGDITYHGPGQLVVYPIIDLENFFTDIDRYLRLLEESVIEMLEYFNIQSINFPGLTGVWLKAEKEKKFLIGKFVLLGFV